MIDISFEISFKDEEEQTNFTENIKKIVKKYPGLLKRNKFQSKHVKLYYHGELAERQLQFWEEILQVRKREYTDDMLKSFFIWWSEPTRDPKPKMKMETMDTWRTSGRLSMWYRKNNSH